ncbi:hypothetical protein [Capnocytophaga bilenii]|uniref:hypothetical protein n=1 Tax=Capnocytophaga bilenii TaxID=2819369 RepID=UPI00259892BA|nr:hypothetical protein [Capnocytophaga bilenii]
MGSITTSCVFFWCSLFKNTLLIDKPDTTLERCALLIVGILGATALVVVNCGVVACWAVTCTCSCVTGVGGVCPLYI